MKFKITLLMFFASIPFISFSQGVITVFSEDGDKFYLVLNGVKQNPTPQTNVRVDGLSNEYYSAKILFEDAAKPEITKNIPTKDAASGQFAEMTFKIKRTKDGELKLRYFSATPVPATYNPPPDMYVMHYGQPAPAPASVTRTTVTTTTSNPVDNGGASISINAGAGGVNMNVNVQDPNMNVSQTTTTTRTTSYSQTTTSDGGYTNAQSQPGYTTCQYPMEWSSFKSAKETIGKASFEETKLSTAKSILNSNCVSSDQVTEICKLFGFEASKLDFAKAAYTRTTDPGNYFKVNNVFDFDASKTELNNYVASHPR
jgi:hypothetical protein